MTISSKRNEPIQLTNLAAAVAMTVGLWVPLIMTLAISLFPEVQGIVLDIFLIRFSGIFPLLLADLVTGPAFLILLMTFVCVTPIVLAILFRLTRLPIFALLMIIDLILGWSKTNHVMATVEHSVPFLSLIATVFLASVLLFYILGLIGSVLLTVGYFDTRKHRRYIESKLPSGQTYDSIHAVALDQLRPVEPEIPPAATA